MTRPSELCQLAGDWRGDLPAGGAMIERKFDGWRALYLPDHLGKPRLFTRNGVPLEGVDHITWHLGRMAEAAGEPMFFDGELVVGDTLAETKAWCESGWKRGGIAGTFHAFDCMPLREWQDGGTDRPLVERKKHLRDLVDTAAEDCWDWRPGSYGADLETLPVSFVEDGWAFDTADVITEARRIWAQGGEGVVVKDAEAPYRRNRNGAWLKVKQANAHKWAGRIAA